MRRFFNWLYNRKNQLEDNKPKIIDNPNLNMRKRINSFTMTPTDTIIAGDRMYRVYLNNDQYVTFYVWAKTTSQAKEKAEELGSIYEWEA